MRVMMIDDEPLAPRGVRARLRKTPDGKIVGDCGDGISGVEGILQAGARSDIP
jgi:DNA-binding NarL/FixJ family response regulator